MLVANGTTNHIYRNGIEVGSVAYDGTLFNPTNALSIGARLTADDSAAESGWWQGKIDDVAYWTRGLSASEVFELFAAGSVGSPVTAADGFRNATPIIVTQPQGGTVYLHEPLPLQVTATGVAPLAYQWWKDGALFFDATNRVFSNPSVEFSAAGNYAVVIMAGNGGSVTSATAAITVSAPAPQPDFGMVMHLKFDETAGSMAADSTTNANNGTLVNFSNPNTNWVPGLFGNALAFLSGGINADAVTVPAQPNLDFGTNAFSLSLWAKGSPYQTASGGLLCKGVAPWESYCLDFYDGTYRFFVRNTAGLVTSAIAPGIMPNNQWQHVAVAYDPGVGQSSMYVDGMLVGAAMTADALFSGLDPLDIGARQGGGNYQYYWTGLLDDVRVYGRAITPLEVRALTYSGIPPELTIATGAGQVTVSWPLEALGYELQSSTNLVSAGWARVPNVTTNWLTLTPNGRQQ
ncbi:MAG: hypothetical protein NT154_15830, partial [Verrucomicrobia bacterium]|nr:hypothetical protein [Verrucomicrobiota bacterium]